MTLPVIELYPGAEDSPFASMMVQLLRQNVLDHAAKLADFALMSGRVSLVAEDIDAAVTLIFDRGKLRVHRGVYGLSDVVLRGTSDALVDLSRLPPDGRFGFLPDVRSDVAKSVLRAFREKRLRVLGAAAHPMLTLRLSRVLSVYA